MAPFSPSTRSGPACTWVWPPTTRSAQPRSSAAAPRLASWTTIVATRRPEVLGLAGGVGEPVADLGERQPRLVAPVAEAAGARVVDAEQPDAARAEQRRAVEHGPAVLAEVAAHERAVVVVAGDPEAVVVLERRGHRVEAERLPRAADRRVVAGVEDRPSRRPRRRRPGPPCPCRCCRGGRRSGAPPSRRPRARAAPGRRQPRRRWCRRSCSGRRSRSRSRSAAASARSSRRPAPAGRRPRRAAARRDRGTPPAASTPGPRHRRLVGRPTAPTTAPRRARARARSRRAGACGRGGTAPRVVDGRPAARLPSGSSPTRAPRRTADTTMSPSASRTLAT